MLIKSYERDEEYSHLFRHRHYLAVCHLRILIGRDTRHGYGPDRIANLRCICFVLLIVTSGRAESGAEQGRFLYLDIGDIF